MEIGTNKYQCPWCGNVMTHTKATSENGGTNTRVTSALICSNCGRKLSQKSRFK